MENYMDSSFIVTSNTIISYSGQHPVVKVPESFIDINVSKIGNGSFMESSKLQCVVLPPSVRVIGSRAFFNCSSLTSVFVPGNIEEVGDNAFSNCNILSDITIYNLELSESEYYSLKNSSNRGFENVYVSREIPKIKLVHSIISSVSSIKPAFRVPSDISSLFHLKAFDEQKGKFSLDKNIPVIGFSVPSDSVSENQAFREYIKKLPPEFYDGKTEEKNDYHVRIGKIPNAEKTIIFTFDDTKTKTDKDKFVISATLMIGYFFWQSAQQVMCNNTRYYIYRRYYLSSDYDAGFLRRDIALYTDDGLVNNREEAQMVYAKYKLMQIL